MMDRSLFLVRSLISDDEGVRNLAFMGPNSAIISDSYNYIGTYISVLIEFYVFFCKTLSPCS